MKYLYNRPGVYDALKAIAPKDWTFQVVPEDKYISIGEGSVIGVAELPALPDMVSSFIGVVRLFKKGVVIEGLPVKVQQYTVAWGEHRIGRTQAQRILKICMEFQEKPLKFGSFDVEICSDGTLHIGCLRLLPDTVKKLAEEIL